MNKEDMIYLLSTGEYERYKNAIPHIFTWWWLRSTGSDGLSVAGVNRDGSVDSFGDYAYSENYVRPALRYSDFECKISRSDKGEDYFVFNEVTWKIIDKENKIAISQLPIRGDKFDDESNDYESSYIRQWLLNWIRGMSIYDDEEDLDVFEYIHEQGKKEYTKGHQQGRAEAIDEYNREIVKAFCQYCNQESCDGGLSGSIQECETIRMLRDVSKDLAEQLKENKNG